MSEVKLNLVDAERILQGTIHGSVADACVAALSAEPETITELEAALERYIKKTDSHGLFACFHQADRVDTEPWDAGVVIIDLKARIVVTESTYSQPERRGQIHYHDGRHLTDVAVFYRVPDDWAFEKYVTQYEATHERRGQERLAHLPIDARPVLYGQALLNFIVTNVRQTLVCRETETENQAAANEEDAEAFYTRLAAKVSEIHARWLMTPLDDLRGQSPREVLFAKRDLIDEDLEWRAWQWSRQGEGPPCLKTDAFAYRFAGFGTHEWVMYYDLVRHLIWSAFEISFGASERSIEDEDLSPELVDAPLILFSPIHETMPAMASTTITNQSENLIARLEQIRDRWLENPNEDSGERTPANIIESERRRLPLTLTKEEMIIDEDCYTCVMMANDPTMGPGFMHFDGSHMDDQFEFSFLRTRAEWEAENRSNEAFDKEFNRRWEEREQRRARGEPVEEEFNLDWVDAFRESKDFELVDDSESTEEVQ